MLGSINSFIAVIFAIASYIYGRKAKVKHQRPIYLLSIFLGVIASLLLLFSFNNISVFIFLIIYNMSGLFIWLSSDPLIMDIAEEEIGKNYFIS